MLDRRRRPPPPHGHGAGVARLAPGRGDVQRGVGGDLCPPVRADRPAPHHADLRQHPPHGRARRARADRAAGPGRRGRPPRQPFQGDAHGRRAAAQGGIAARPGGHRVAGAGHRHRLRRSGVPARLAAVDHGLPAARRPLRPRGRRHAQGPPVPAQPRRPGGRVRAAGVGGAGGPGRDPDPRRAARHPCAADRRRVRGARVVRRRALRGRVRGVSVPRPGARAVRHGGADAGRRLHHAPRAARRLPAPGRGQRPAARPPRRPPDGADRRRRHSRHLRLRGESRARRDHGGHHPRGLRHREHGRRRVPARQYLLAHPAGGRQHRTRRACRRPAAHHSLLAGRGAGPHPGAVGRGVGAARRGGDGDPGSRGARRPGGAGRGRLAGVAARDAGELGPSRQPSTSPRGATPWAPCRRPAPW